MSEGCYFCDDAPGTKCSETDCDNYACKPCKEDCDDCSSPSLCPDCFNDHEQEHAQEVYDDYMDELAEGMGMERCFHCREFFDQEDLWDHQKKCAF